MDWARAIELNHPKLVRIVAELVAMVELTVNGVVSNLIYRAVLRVLHPAESAVRRLIVIAARGLKVELPPPRPKLKDRVIAGKGPRKKGGWPDYVPALRSAQAAQRRAAPETLRESASPLLDLRTRSAAGPAGPVLFAPANGDRGSGACARSRANARRRGAGAAPQPASRRDHYGAREYSGPSQTHGALESPARAGRTPQAQVPAPPGPSARPPEKARRGHRLRVDGMPRAGARRAQRRYVLKISIPYDCDGGFAVESIGAHAAAPARADFSVGVGNAFI